jgi:hypothetical protein
MHNHFAVHLFGALAFSAALAGCGSKDSELSTAITDCQLDAHREIVETKNQSEEKRKFALGEFSDACLKKKGFKPMDSKPGCLIEPTSPDDGHGFTRPSAECWSK